jgi:hypothetical protein
MEMLDCSKCRWMVREFIDPDGCDEWFCLKEGCPYCCTQFEETRTCLNCKIYKKYCCGNPYLDKCWRWKKEED